MEKMDARNADFDSLLEGVGGFGWYQIRLWFMCTVYLETFMSQNQMFMIFAGAQPKWTCNYNGSDIASTNATLGTGSVCSSVYQTCPEIVYQEDISTIATEFGLYCEKSWVVEILMAIQMAGILVGAAFWGQMAELYGRKWVLCTIATLELVVCILMAFSPSWHMFTPLLFLCGFGTGGYWNVVYVFVQEQVIKKWRVFASALNGWATGGFIFPLVCWYFADWRNVLLVVNIIGLTSLSAFYWCEESPRWLIQHNRLDEAHRALRRIATVNKKPPPNRALIQYLHDVTVGQTKKRYSYKHLFTGWDASVKVLALAASWFVVSCVSNALAFNVKDLPGNRYINALIMASVGTVASCLVILLSKWCGRKVLHQMSLTSMGLCMLTVVLAIYYGASLGRARDILITTFAVFGCGFSAPSWQIVYLYSVEMYPTVLRPLSNGMGSMAARLGAIVAPLILLMGKSSTIILPYAIFLALCIANMLISCTVLPETRGKPLPENIPVKKRSSSASGGIGERLSFVAKLP